MTVELTRIRPDLQYLAPLTGPQEPGAKTKPNPSRAEMIEQINHALRFVVKYARSGATFFSMMLVDVAEPTQAEGKPPKTRKHLRIWWRLVRRAESKRLHIMDSRFTPLPPQASYE